MRGHRGYKPEALSDVCPDHQAEQGLTWPRVGYQRESELCFRENWRDRSGGESIKAGLEVALAAKPNQLFSYLPLFK